MTEQSEAAHNEVGKGLSLIEHSSDHGDPITHISSSIGVQEAQEKAEKAANFHLRNDALLGNLLHDRRERNRVSARKSRLRKKYFVDALIQKVEALEEELNGWKSKYQDLAASHSHARVRPAGVVQTQHSPMISFMPGGPDVGPMMSYQLNYQMGPTTATYQPNTQTPGVNPGMHQSVPPNAACVVQQVHHQPTAMYQQPIVHHHHPNPSGPPHHNHTAIVGAGNFTGGVILAHNPQIMAMNTSDHAVKRRKLHEPAKSLANVQSTAVYYQSPTPPVTKIEHRQNVTTTSSAPSSAANVWKILGHLGSEGTGDMTRNHAAQMRMRTTDTDFLMGIQEQQIPFLLSSVIRVAQDVDSQNAVPLVSRFGPTLYVSKSFSDIFSINAGMVVKRQGPLAVMGMKQDKIDSLKLPVTVSMNDDVRLLASCTVRAEDTDVPVLISLLRDHNDAALVYAIVCNPGSKCGTCSVFDERFKAAFPLTGL